MKIFRGALFSWTFFTFWICEVSYIWFSKVSGVRLHMYSQRLHWLTSNSMHTSMNVSTPSFFLLCALPLLPNTALSPSLQVFMLTVLCDKIKLAFEVGPPHWIPLFFFYLIHVESHIASLNLNHLVKKEWRLFLDIIVSLGVKVLWNLKAIMHEKTFSKNVIILM